ncbi:MAG: methyltransferase [Bacteroidota bacterium]
MSLKPFQFKQFNIQQDKTAMKIGTDGVLLGAWANLDFQPESILDIGTGTGIISLQMAQRSDADIVDAIELEPNAYEQAVVNFENSDWGDRLFCYHASLLEFKEEIDEKYDLIISNPPYFSSKHKETENKRALARQTETLSFYDLLSATAKLLSNKGNCAFIIPFDEEENFLATAEKLNLFPLRITRVKGTKSTPIKRSLLQLSFKRSQAKIDELIIEIDRHVYTKDYKNLVKDFYLKM